jgi:dienelactone hydrolase
MIKARVFLFLLTATLVSCGGNSRPRQNIVPEVQVVEFGDTRVFSDHIETDIRLPTSDTTLGGTLFLPLGQSVFPVVVLQPGSQQWMRATTMDYQSRGAAYYNSLGVAAWSYDKRGVGQSGGICCQADIAQLAGDALAGIDAISLHPQIDVAQIGIDGVSQGGWVAINAAARSTRIAFVISKVGPAVSTYEEKEYSRLTGDNVCIASGLSNNEIDDFMAANTPAGYDRESGFRQNEPTWNLVLWWSGHINSCTPEHSGLGRIKDRRGERLGNRASAQCQSFHGH